MNTASDGEETTEDGRAFHTRAPAIPNARSPTVRSLVRGTISWCVVADLRRRRESLSATQCRSLVKYSGALCGYSDEKQVGQSITLCALGLATNEGPGAMKRRGRTCATHSPNVLQRGVLTGVDLSDMKGSPPVWHCRNRALTELVT